MSDNSFTCVLSLLFLPVLVGLDLSSKEIMFVIGETLFKRYTIEELSVDSCTAEFFVLKANVFA